VLSQPDGLTPVVKAHDAVLNWPLCLDSSVCNVRAACLSPPKWLQQSLFEGERVPKELPR
jgi:hypothetical protein